MAVNALKSHPNRTLVKHLEGVKNRCLKELRRISRHINWKEVFGFSEEEISKVLEVSAVLHDLGKATKEFQMKLEGKRASQRGGHAFLSSLFVFKELVQRNLPLPLAFCGYAIVRHHHTYLISPQDESISSTDKLIFEQQMKSISMEIFDYLNVDPRLDIREIELLIEDAADEAEDLGKSFYFLMKLLYSILISSDRLDAVFEDEEASVDKLDLSKLKHYISCLEPKSWIDELRKDFQSEIERFEGIAKEILVIRAPTGIGKTIGNLILASKIAKDGAIVYTLPFINIIEQTADNLRRMFGNDSVMEYHHLAQVFGDNENLSEKISDAEYDQISKALMIRDLWLSPIIVTTFVSLLENLIGGSKAPFLHRLVGGVLILDEMQAVPKESWDIVKETFEFLPQIGISVIMSTATMPVIFRGMEVVKEPENKYFLKLNRTHVNFEGEMTLDDLKNYLEGLLSDGKRTLIILNTIKSAEEIFDFLSRRYDDVCFLSSRVVPVERRARIGKIKNGEIKICISTQVVEAGVDISFERVVRDIGPVDSIVQASGRCNRNFEREKGEVKIVAVRDERTFLSKYVYGSTLIEHALSILSEYPEFDEKAFPDVVKKYYERLVRYTSTDKNEYVKKLQRLDISALSTFRLIKDEQAISFLILLNEQVEKLLSKAIEISEKFEGFRKRDFLAAIMSELSGYIVSTRLNLESSKELPAFDKRFGMVVINREMVSEWYDPVKGLREKAIGGGYFV